MKNRLLSLLLICILCTGMIAGCAGKNQVVNYEDADQEITTITFFGNKYEPENVRVIEEIITGFMKENPDIRVSYESLKGTEYYEALLKRMEHGKGNDVFMVNHDVLLQLEQNGQMADLSGLSSISHYSDAMRGQMTGQDGAVYWVPTTVSVFGLYCNLDMLKQYGQEVPKDLGEWEQCCNYFLEQDITPVVANNDISLKTLAIGLGFHSVYRQDRQAEVFGRLNSGEEQLSSYLKPGFSLVESFIRRGYLDAAQTLTTKKTSDDLEEFAQGKAPFLLTGAWAAGRLEEMEPGFAFEVAPLPVLEDGALLVVNADTRLSINADSFHPEAAMKFVEYFTRKENIQKFADQQSSFSPLKDSVPPDTKAVRPLVSCYEAGDLVFGTDTMLDISLWELTAEASRKLLSGDSLEAVLVWMDEQAEEEVQQ